MKGKKVHMYMTSFNYSNKYRVDLFTCIISGDWPGNYVFFMYFVTFYSNKEITLIPLLFFYKILLTLGKARWEFLTCYFTGTFFSLVHLFTNWVNIGDFFMLLIISKDERYWPLMSPLPSYGYGREHKGPRYGSLIHGQDLKDVTITGRLCIFVPFFLIHMENAKLIPACIHVLPYKNIGSSKSFWN